MKIKGNLSLKKAFSKKPVKIISIIVVIALVGFGVYKSPIVQKRLTAAANTGVQQKTSTVRKGDISSAVSGSGALYYDRTSKVASRVSTTVSKIYFKLGDRVKAGDLICEFDDIDAQQALNDKKNNLLQSQLSTETTFEDVNKLAVKAKISGQVSDIKVKKGDNVSKGTALFTITDNSKLKMNVSFNAADAAKISLNQVADVYLTSMMQAVKGKVTYISSQPTATTSGGQLYTVEIQIDNPGAVLGGMTANAEIETSSGVVTSTNTGTLEYISKEVVTSEVSGTVDSISIKDSQKVTSGAVVINLKSDDVLRNAQLSNMKIDNSKNQVDSAEQQLSYYKIYAPIDGVISAQTLKVGDSVKTGDVVTTITDTSLVQFDINIDELDIAKLAVGQKATITVDALTDTATKPIEGEVVKIAFQGTSSNGVSTFPVTVKVNDRLDQIKGGMNATANIQVGSAKGVLFVPIEAVTKVAGKSYVWVKSDQAGGQTQSQTPGTGSAQQGNRNTAQGGNQNRTAAQGANVARNATASFGQQSGNRNQSQNYYANAVRKEVEVGMNNDSLIEIKSGLKEGDIVVLPQTQTSNQSMMMPTGMTGGAPAGGQGGAQQAGGARR